MKEDTLESRISLLMRRMSELEDREETKMDSVNLVLSEHGRKIRALDIRVENVERRKKK